MDNEAGQRITEDCVNRRQLPCPRQDAPDRSEKAMNINVHQLHDITELLEVIDGFLRSDTIADHLTNYLHATGADQPRLPDGASYTTGLLIDRISLNAHMLRTHQRKPLQ